MKNKIVVETSWDDGAELDFKVADLLKKYKLPGTFYIPINYKEKKELTDEQIRKLAEDFEIGGHTIDHYVLTRIEKLYAWEEIYEGKRILESIVGVGKIKSFCYPRGKYNKEVKKMVHQAGYVDARTTKVLDTSLDYDPYEKGTTIHMYPRKEYGLDSIKDAAFKMIDKVREEGGRFHLWGHSWEIAKLGLWQDLEDIMKKMQEDLCDQ